VSAALRPVASVGLALAVAACSSSSSNGSYPTYQPGDASTSTMGGNPDVSLGTPNGTVAIVIHAPQMGTTPTTLSTNGPADVSAKVTIMAGTDLIDPSSVRAALSSGDSTAAPLSTAPLVGPTGDNEYTGKLSLAGLKSGAYTISVTARSSAGVMGSATVKVMVDAGPLITVLSPQPGRHYKGSIIVLVAADPGPSPPLSPLTSTIAGLPVNLQPTSTAGQYRAIFDLTMPLALMDDQLFEVGAENASHTRTDIKFAFNVDTSGPAITNTTPPPGTIVGNVVRLAASISDGAGIDESTLQVLIGDKTTPQFRLPLVLDPTGHYSALFDSNSIARCKLNDDPCNVRPTISFRAADDLGNETTVSYEIAIDNLPPVADLQPPPIRVSKLNEGLRCSTLFDPLDFKTFPGDMPNDLCQVPQMFDLRARIQDGGNHALFIKQVPISAVDPDATAVYILDTVAVSGVPQPLVVDTDDDGYCDAVNPKLEPTTAPLTGPRQVLKVRMKPVPPGGAGDYYPPHYALQPDPLPPGCGQGIDMDPPEWRCRLGPQPTVAINYIGLPAIWSIEPIAPDDASYCFGSQFDAKVNNVTEATAASPPSGWKCIAVVTADTLGNASTSAPLRVYLADYKYGGSRQYCTPPPANAGPPPTCTGTYNRATREVTSKACKTRNYKRDPVDGVEVCYKNDCGGAAQFIPSP
jgi:hypothetical protein